MLSSNTYSISLFCVLADARETRRVDTYISALFPEKSRAYIQKMIEEEKITTNGTYFNKNKKIYRGDVIEIRWIVEDMHLEAQDIPIDIVFENEDFAVINKDPHMNTHPTPGAEGRKGTLVNALLYHFKTLGIRSDEHTSPQPSPIGERECIDDDMLDVHVEDVHVEDVYTDLDIQSSALSSRA
jgi:23S rRNA-/tRNA-specific pseudouridylate synthase